jgi:uncharacterized protein YcfJ
MTRLITAAIAAASLTMLAAPAEAKGCIKGALVGGAAGHMAGHGKIGAAAGCVVGRHQANKRDRQQIPGQNSGSQNTGSR